MKHINSTFRTTTTTIIHILKIQIIHVCSDVISVCRLLYTFDIPMGISQFLYKFVNNCIDLLLEIRIIFDADTWSINFAYTNEISFKNQKCNSTWEVLAMSFNTHKISLVWQIQYHATFTVKANTFHPYTAYSFTFLCDDEWHWMIHQCLMYNVTLSAIIILNTAFSIKSNCMKTNLFVKCYYNCSHCNLFKHHFSIEKV